MVNSLYSKKDVSLAPLGHKEKLFVLDNFLENSKKCIISFYEIQINFYLPLLEDIKKMRWVNKKIANKDIKLIKLKSEKIIEKIKKIKNNWIQTLDEIKKIIKNDTKTIPYFSENIDFNSIEVVINELISIYSFIEKDNIHLLVNTIKNKTDLLLNPNISKILEEIKTKFDIFIDFYWLNTYQRDLALEEIKDLSMAIKLLKLQLEEKEKELNSARRLQNKTEISVKYKEAERERLKQDREKLTKKIEELEKELDSREIQEQNVKSVQNSSEDGLVWEELAHKAEFKLWKTKEELQVAKKENTQLLEQIESLNWQIQSMESLKLRFAQFSTIEAFLDQCEADIDNLNIDEMIKYLSLANCPINLKQKAIKVLIHFIDEVLLKHIVKCTSSTTHSNWWAGWWLYANNFLKPIMNFLKQKWKNMWTQEFLEYLTCINWGDLINEYKDWPDFKSKKDKIFSNINFHLWNKDKYEWIFKALLFLSDKLKDFSIWNTDLNLLSQNIKGCLNSSDYTKNELKKLVIKASSLRKI